LSGSVHETRNGVAHRTEPRTNAVVGRQKPSPLSPDQNSESGWPDYVLDEKRDEAIEIDVFEELARHLDARDVAVLMQIGSEKLRYLTGEAVAIHATGRITRVSLNDIYDQAF
jgi:hypothetical protein